MRIRPLEKIDSKLREAAFRNNIFLSLKNFTGSSIITLNSTHNKNKAGDTGNNHCVLGNKSSTV